MILIMVLGVSDWYAPWEVLYKCKDTIQMDGNSASHIFSMQHFLDNIILQVDFIRSLHFFASPLPNLNE